MAKSAREQVGGDAVKAATGKTHDEWNSVLIDAGAKAWKHKQIADHLIEEHGVDGWWAQGITVDFEQNVQGRLPGQRPDGTFECSVRRTLPGDQRAALERAASAVAERYGEPRAKSMTLKTPNVRFVSEDGIRVVVDAQPSRPTGTPVGITVMKLPDQGAYAAAKEWAAATLDALK
ncbi:hypothetical protein [uncultured Agrococcus sp.]|uniref:hypothetical protein n=1 Tax=uncultured Agrococcus sp. TaxID=382258 RepID=UPI0025D9B228|nr:hypothetical protein [uncultured Agrococcus sp.]